VIAALNPDAARLALAARSLKPDLIISDLHLGNGRTGMEFIEDVRAETRTMIPAFLISGDTTPDRLREARAHGYHLLHKPVAPIRLRAMVNRMTRPTVAPDAMPRS
jgi:CheY-like chemotaxis protein